MEFVGVGARVLVAGFVGGGRRAAGAMIENHWLATNELAAQIGLDETVRQSLYQRNASSNSFSKTCQSSSHRRLSQVRHMKLLGMLGWLISTRSKSLNG